jgi:transposase
MMGIKPRSFQPIDLVTLEDLVPADHFYRHLDRTFALSFVRDLVADHYAAGGRPSIDPVVFFKLQLVMFFEGLRSERQLMAVATDRLSVRWYLGYDLDEPLPDHSSLTRIRQRFGLSVFRQFFETVLDRCEEVGLIWGRELLVDATKVPGNADLDSLVPRLKDVVDDHLVELFGSHAESPTSERWDVLETCQLAPDRPLSPGYERVSHRMVSRTDPDATPMKLSTGQPVLGYQDHYVVDGGRARIILSCLVMPGAVMENQPFLDQLRRTLFRRKLRPRRVIGDTAYGTVENLQAMEQAGIQLMTPLPKWEKSSPYFKTAAFTYDSEQDVYHCPNGATLTLRNVDTANERKQYRAPIASCRACPLREWCTSNRRGRVIYRSFHEDLLERVLAYEGTPAFEKAMRKRRVWLEPLFAEAKQWHGLSRFRLRGVHNVNIEGVLIAAGQNLKRYLANRGWGKRWGPMGQLVVPDITGIDG